MNAADFPPIPMAEALERLAGMPAWLEAQLAGRDDATLRRRTGAGGDFSLVEHACHLRDLEREGYLVRVRRILAEVTPELMVVGHDGEHRREIEALCASLEP